MTKQLLLVSYPPLRSVVEQISMPIDIEGRFGAYTGKRPDAEIDETTPSIGNIFEEVYIAPEKLENISSKLGGLTIIGITREGEKARVEITPFDELDTHGTIFIGEETTD